jgi:hypothetical protein
VNACLRPLDPIDAEAVASGAEPPFAPDAAEHAALCAVCGAAVEEARALNQALAGLAAALPPVSDLAEPVTRLRAFSRRERRTYALWKAPVLLSGGVVVAGLALLLAPSLDSAAQTGLGTAALVPFVSLLRSLARWALELARVAPSSLEALSDALRQERTLGLVSLLLLAPAGFGLMRIVARVRSRR